MKILLTGGAGFIGSNLARYLVRRNLEVIVLDNLLTGSLANLDSIEVEFIRGDIRNRLSVRKAMKKADAVVHLAAVSGSLPSLKDPYLTFETNVSGSINVLEEARRHETRVFLISSASVYGPEPSVPTDEKQPPAPASPYAVSKLNLDFLTPVYYETYGLRVTSFRLFNIYGPRQDPHSLYGAVIPAFIKAALEKKPFKIEGDGLQTRDFLFVEDLAGTIYKALKTGNSIDGKIINLGSGYPTTIMELARVIGKIASIEPVTFSAPRRTGDVYHSVADISMAQKLLGHSPVTSLEKGLLQTYEWFRQTYSTDVRKKRQTVNRNITGEKKCRTTSDAKSFSYKSSRK